MKQRNNSVGPQVRVSKKVPKMLPVLGILSLLSGLQAATQYFAFLYGYQTALGMNFNHVYAPWAILKWAFAWYHKYPDQFMRAGSIGIVVSSAGLLVVAVWRSIAANSSSPNEFMHGSARWADKKDIIEAGLLGKNSKSEKTPFVYVGGWQDKSGRFHYLRHSGPEHVLTSAPTRSGKGVGLVIPTLLSWSQSCIITDLKGELWALTSGWRQKHAGNKVLRFEPAAMDTGVKWNPLEEIRLGTEYEVGDAQNLAHLIVDPDGKGLESHWQKTSFALLVGVILHALYKARNEGRPPATLPECDTMLSDPARPTDDLWREMASYLHSDGINHPAVGSAGRDQMDRPEEEAGSVLSTAKSYLALYRDPVVAKSVGRSEFRIKDLMHYDDPVSLYVVTQPADKSRLRPLVRIMICMVVRVLADKLIFENGRPKANYNHSLLMMLDEFPSLGKIEIFQESLAFLAGYGIKCYLICQDINQLKSREIGYGHDESITSNCHIQNAFPPNRVETADHLSRLTGQTTIVKESITTSGKRTAMLMGRVSRTHQEVQRPLLTVDECLRMPGPKKGKHGEIVEPGDMIIYVAGYPAIYGKQPRFLKDPVFYARYAIAAPIESDRLSVPPENVSTVTI
jgi:type IV secretion system protein VirD4